MKKILHIEDNAENRLLVRRLLESREYRVVERVDGLSGVQAAADERPDLILMDINLPGIDGHHAATLIRGIRGMERVPIVAITSNVLPGAREEAIVSGCDGYISKPIDVDSFGRTIEQFLQGHQEDISPEVKTDYLVKYSRKLAEALETHTYARRFLEGVIVQNPLSTLITDTGGVCLMHNAEFFRLFKFATPGGLVGQYNVFDDPALNDSHHQEELKRLFTGLERIEFMATFEVPGTGARFIRIIGFPILDDSGALRNAVIQHEDITDELLAIEEQQRLTEQLFQAQRMESIAQLVGGVARDYNSLLVGVLGSVELLMQSVGKEGHSAQLLSMIKQSALRMSDLTKNLLAYSQRGAGSPEPIAPSTFLAEIMPLIRRIAGPRVEIKVEVGDALVPVYADRGQLQQVLTNVVLNGVEATAGPGTISVSASGPLTLSSEEQGEGPGGPFIRFRVRDEGKGMSEDVESRLFDPFFTTKEPGRGFGMSAVLGIVTNHGGRINVDTAPDQGTTVDILWPVAHSAGYSGSGEGSSGAVDKGENDETREKRPWRNISPN